MSLIVCELQWVSYVFEDFNLQINLPISLFCDNQTTIHIAENLVFHERIKHLQIDCHLVRNQLKKGFVLPKHVSSHNQIADIFFFTKYLSNPQFTHLRSKLGLISLDQMPTWGGGGAVGDSDSRMQAKASLKLFSSHRFGANKFEELFFNYLKSYWPKCIFLGSFFFAVEMITVESVMKAVDRWSTFLYSIYRRFFTFFSVWL